MQAAREIAGILGVQDRIKWIVASMEDLPLEKNISNMTFCIEVLEHIKRNKKAVNELSRITKNYLLITTPNLWFPVVAHDTRLPFCHMLPIPLRKLYAKLARRSDNENDNLFWSPLALDRQLKTFKRVSKWLHYKSFEKFKETYPLYLPYGKGYFVKSIPKMQEKYYRLVSKLKNKSYLFAPNLAGVYKKN